MEHADTLQSGQVPQGQMAEDEEVLVTAQALGYPGATINKSSLKCITRQNWPPLLAFLAWMVDLIEIIGQIQEEWHPLLFPLDTNPDTTSTAVCTFESSEIFENASFHVLSVLKAMLQV